RRPHRGGERDPRARRHQARPRAPRVRARRRDRDQHGDRPRRADRQVGGVGWMIPLARRGVRCEARAVRIPWALLAAAGCYRPAPVPGTPCSDTGQCPDPLVCDRGTCEPMSLVPDGGAACACADAPAPHCAAIAPSNGVDRGRVADVSAPIALEGAITIDTSTGAITGGFTRAAGTGVIAGIEYLQQGALGVFVFHALDVRGTVTLAGTRPAVFLVGTTVAIGGTIDGSAHAGAARATPGPGGGAGAALPAMAGGCGAGGRAASAAPYSDAGGGGGGGGDAGGMGGAS